MSRIRTKQLGLYTSVSHTHRCKAPRSGLALAEWLSAPEADHERADGCRPPDDHTSLWAFRSFPEGRLSGTSLPLPYLVFVFVFLLEYLPCFPIWSIQSFKTQRSLVWLHLHLTYNESLHFLCYLWIWFPYFSLLSLSSHSVFPVRWLSLCIDSTLLRVFIKKLFIEGNHEAGSTSGIGILLWAKAAHFSSHWSQNSRGECLQFN